jgi:hypothetical protein
MVNEGKPLEMSTSTSTIAPSSPTIAQVITLANICSWLYYRAAFYVSMNWDCLFTLSPFIPLPLDGKGEVVLRGGEVNKQYQRTER